MEQLPDNPEPAQDDSDARLAYDTYRQAVGGTAFNDIPLPGFDGLGDRQKSGWVEVAAALWDEYLLTQPDESTEQ
jgi:hypothetical protein